MKYLDLAILTVLLLVACNGGQPTQCEAPAQQASSQVLNAVMVPLPDVPGTTGLALGRTFPSSCIEFDYMPVDKGFLDASKCRMLWCGSYNGGLATLWCH